MPSGAARLAIAPHLQRKSAQIRGERFLPQMEMRLGPATQAAFVRGFLRCLITAWRRNDRFGPTALPLSRATSATFAKASCPFAISRLRTGKPAVASGPSCSRSKSNEQVGEEAAMPGQPVALARVFWNVPRRFTLENHQAAAGSAAIIRQAQETSRFAEPTLRQIVAPRNTKNFPPCAETVDVETSLWKTEEN